MKADNFGQSRAVSEPSKFPLVKLLLVVAVLVGLLLFWFWSGEDTSETAVVTPPAPLVVERIVLPAPDIPRPPEPVSAPEPDTPTAQEELPAEAPAAPVLPSREESDDLLLQQLESAGADGRLNGLVGSEHPLETSAALIDGVSRGAVLRKILPANPPQEPFAVDQRGDVTYMSSEGYERYDSYADSIAALDVEAMVGSFHLLRPIYERAYQQLGLEPEDFDNAIIRTLDIILATPEIDSPIALERTSVMYTYADAQLEGLPSVQKQLLRMGPKNVRRIKAQAQLLKDGLLSQ